MPRPLFQKLIIELEQLFDEWHVSPSYPSFGGDLAAEKYVLQSAVELDLQILILDVTNWTHL